MLSRADGNGLSGRAIQQSTRGGDMWSQTIVRSGIALVAGGFVLRGVASYGMDAFGSPEISLAALVLTIFGLAWLR